LLTGTVAIRIADAGADDDDGGGGNECVLDETVDVNGCDVDLLVVGAACEEELEVVGAACEDEDETLVVGTTCVENDTTLEADDEVIGRMVDVASFVLVMGAMLDTEVLVTVLLVDTGTATAAPPATQPGTRSAAVAAVGPSVTATQPGRVLRLPMIASVGKGLVAAHALFWSSV